MAELDDAGPPPGELPLLGYPDRWSVAPGETIDFMVSSSAGDFDAEVVRLRHGDENPDGPGLRETVVPGVAGGHHPGRLQVAYAGSYVRVDGFGDHARESFTMLAWIAPTTLPIERPQGILGDLGDRSGAALVIEPSGSLALLLGRDGAPATLSSGRPMTAGEWHLVAAGYEARNRRAWVLQLPLAPWDLQGQVFRTATVEADYTGRGPGAALLIGALAAGAGGPDEAAEATGRTPAGGPTWAHFNGKIEGPRVFGASPSPAELEALLDAPDQVLLGEPMTAGTIASWDFAVGIASTRVTDTGPHGLHGETVGMPTRGVTGHGWTGTALSPEAAPEQYGAIHFHEDDVEDCGWTPDVTVTLPEDLPSGVYALRTAAAGYVDRIPFFVHPGAGTERARAAVVLPTFTYLAYANERLLFDTRSVAGLEVREGVSGNAYDRYLPAHPELGKSVYDRHVDGSGVCYSSSRRPVLNMRPDYHWWCTNATERLPTDLYLIDWLDEKGFSYDVLTDHDVDREGAELLSAYDAVLTGSHPEYCTDRLLSAYESYLWGSAGRLLYLGGNGFYWVVGIHPERPHVMEVRKTAGTRTWEPAPGEAYLSTTGEPGGLWRYRGRGPNRLVGVGFAAQDNVASPAPGYVRLPGSFDDRARFIFEGIGPDEVIGEFGLMCGGAAGYEVDRLDDELGSPPQAIRLATSALRHSDDYLLVVEDVLSTEANLGGSVNDKVRADLVFMELPNGGAVFSVGSINWCGSLSHNDYDNNVSRVTENVLRQFLA